MLIGLIDVDSKMVNLALMKISAWHKAQGDSVSWFNPLFEKPDRVYASKVFKFSQDWQYWPDCPVIQGGTGYDIKSTLPSEIEAAAPDYSIYPDCDYSIQFFSRGCIRRCPFCVVHEKEGNIKAVEPMALNPHGSRIEVFDNNFFANPEWKNAVNWLKKVNQPVNFHGIDIRIMTDEHAQALMSLRMYKQIHIAWDNCKENILERLESILKIIPAWKVMCYVLIGYNSTPNEDLFRVRKLDELGVSPFAMPFDKKDVYQKRFARWVNHKGIFKTVKFEDYR